MGAMKIFSEFVRGSTSSSLWGWNHKTASSPPLLQSSYSTMSSREMLCRAVTPHSFCHNAAKPTTLISCTGAAQGTLVAKWWPHISPVRWGQAFNLMLSADIRSTARRGCDPGLCWGISTTPGTPRIRLASSMQHFTPELRTIAKNPCVMEGWISLVVFPPWLSCWACRQGWAGGAYQLTPSRVPCHLCC